MLLLVLKMVLEMIEKFKLIHSSYALAGQELLTVRRSFIPHPTPPHPTPSPPPAFKFLLQSEEDVNQSFHTEYLPVDSPDDSEFSEIANHLEMRHVLHMWLHLSLKTWKKSFPLN